MLIVLIILFHFDGNQMNSKNSIKFKTHKDLIFKIFGLNTIILKQKLYYPRYNMHYIMYYVY